MPRRSKASASSGRSRVQSLNDSANESNGTDPLEPSPSVRNSGSSRSETLAEHSQELEALYQTVEKEIQQDEQLTAAQNGHSNDTADTPLLPQSSTTTPSPSSWIILTGAAANLCSATLGAGVLALPFAMRQAGLVVGTLLLLASAVLTVVSIHLLGAVQTPVDVPTLEERVAVFLGPRMKQIVEACIVIFCLGCSVSYVIAVGDILFITLGWQRLTSMLLVWFTLMMPLSMFRHMQSFQWTSGTGVAAITTLVFSSFLHLVNDDYGQQHGGHGRWDTNDTWAEDEMYGPYVADLGGNYSTWDENPVNLADYLWPENGLISVLKACPIVMFAFSCQVNVPSIYRELNNQQLMHKVTYLSATVCFFLYASISIIALADFGDRIEPNILVNYKHDSGMMQFATASMAAAVITAFPLNVFPSRLAVIGVWKRYVSQRLHRQQPNATLTDALLEDLVDDNASAGSDDSQYGTISRSLSLDVASDNGAGPARQDAAAASLDVGGESDGAFDLRLHIVTTLLLTGLALGFAILIPDISVVFGLLGGTTTSLLGFLVPGALALRINHRGLVCVASILLVGGVVISILTTAVTVYSTVTGES